MSGWALVPTRSCIISFFSFHKHDRAKKSVLATVHALATAASDSYYPLRQQEGLELLITDRAVAIRVDLLRENRLSLFELSLCLSRPVLVKRSFLV
jgi:hypothetical protein